MNRLTLGKLVLDTAKGREKERSISAQEIKVLSREISERVIPKIEQIRDGQRRALEDSKPVVLL